MERKDVDEAALMRWEGAFVMGTRTEKRKPKQDGRPSFARRMEGEKGASLLEMTLLLPILVVLAFGVIDLGRLIHARLVVTNVCREGASLASRDIKSGTDLIDMLQSSATPFDLKNRGRIYVFKIKAGESAQNTLPYITIKSSDGSYNAGSTITGNLGDPPGGLSSAIYKHLRYNGGNKTSDISEINVVEVFYLYQPITPLPNFVQKLILPTGGILVASKAVY